MSDKNYSRIEIQFIEGRGKPDTKCEKSIYWDKIYSCYHTAYVRVFDSNGILRVPYAARYFGKNHAVSETEVSVGSVQAYHYCIEPLHKLLQSVDEYIISQEFRNEVWKLQ